MISISYVQTSTEGKEIIDKKTNSFEPIFFFLVLTVYTVVGMDGRLCLAAVLHCKACRVPLRKYSADQQYFVFKYEGIFEYDIQKRMSTESHYTVFQSSLDSAPNIFLSFLEKKNGRDFFFNLKYGKLTWLRSSLIATGIFNP